MAPLCVFIIFLIHTVVVANAEVSTKFEVETDFKFKNNETKIGVEMNKTKTRCYNLTEKFPLKKLIDIGRWYVVGIIPTELYPEQREQICYGVDFCECDVSALRWLVNTSRAGPVRRDVLARINGRIIVRQRYYTSPSADVWSKRMEGYQGCFEQVASLDTYKNEDHDAMSSEGALMQLSLVKGKDKYEYLLQMLWGELISAVIYREEPSETDDERLSPVLDLVTKLRGEQKRPIFCKNPEPVATTRQPRPYNY